MFNRDKLNKLFQYGVALTGDNHMAHDLVQDAVEKLISKTFVINKMAYAKKTMRNKYLDHIKSKVTSSSVPLEEDIPVENRIDEMLDNKMMLGEVLNKLKPDEREILYLWAVEEYTTDEIAKKLEIPKGTITSKLKRLRDKLQKEYGENNG